MTHFEAAVVRLDHELRAVDALNEHAIFGSTAIRMRGIISRDPGDIDVLVSKRAWGLLLARPGWHAETPNAGDPPILAFDTVVPLHLFYEWKDDFVQINAPFSIAHYAETVEWGGFSLRCVMPEEILRHKRAALSYGDLKVQKHRPDIAAIEAHLSRGR